MPVCCSATLQTKEEIAKEVQDELSKAFAAFGYEILQALVTDIDPDPRVKAAMNEVRASVAVTEGRAACAEGRSTVCGCTRQMLAAATCGSAYVRKYSDD